MQYIYVVICMSLYIRTRCKSQGLRKSKRNACPGNCKSGILMSVGFCVGVGGPVQPRLSNNYASFVERQREAGKSNLCGLLLRYLSTDLKLLPIADTEGTGGGNPRSLSYPTAVNMPKFRNA